MKYFSVKDWNEWDDMGEAVIAYRNYVSSVRPELPEDIQRLTGAGGDISLNDGEITSVTISIVSSAASMTIDGKWIHGTETGRRVFQLMYSGVVLVDSSIDPDAEGLHGSGYGYHGFDEFEVIETGLYEHRMLFSSGIEFAIRFGNFILSYTDYHN